jgi:hypothetical protein
MRAWLSTLGVADAMYLTQHSTTRQCAIITTVFVL